jgi:hypothetical protein
MRMRLERHFLGEEYTIGRLFVDGLYLCDTIEDKVRDLNQDGDLDDPGEGKVYGHTAIPYGKYEVELTMSQKFTRLVPLVKDVKHFTGIRIHRGNTADDSAGCILPGENKEKGKVLNSTHYEMVIVERMLKAMVAGERITLEILNAK